MLRDLALGMPLCSFWWFGAQVARLHMTAYVSAQAACDELLFLDIDSRPTGGHVQQILGRNHEEPSLGWVNAFLAFTPRIVQVGACMYVLVCSRRCAGLA